MPSVEIQPAEGADCTAAQNAVVGKFTQLLRPMRRMQLDEWADAHRFLPPKSSALSGRWNTDTVSVFREAMRAFSDPGVEKVVLMASPQGGKSELLINAVLYCIEREPCPILMLQPTDDLARAFSRDRISASLEYMPSVKEKMAPEKSRSGESTIFRKSFAGGVLTIGSSESRTDAASRPIKLLVADEVDKYRDTTALTKAERRTSTYADRKILIACSPAPRAVSQVYAEFLRGDQCRFEMCCPECSEYHLISFKNVRWHEKADTRELVYQSAYYKCPLCKAKLTEAEKNRGVRDGRWVALHPEIRGTRSFHIPMLCYPFHGATMAEHVREWLEAKRQSEEGDDGRLIEFHQDFFAEPYYDESRKINPADLYENRRPVVSRVGNNYTINRPIVQITGAVDVQADRLEYEITGWGILREQSDKSPEIKERIICVGIQYGVIDGDPGVAATWLRLQKKLNAMRIQNDKKIQLKIRAVGIDTGGHHTSDVRSFCAGKGFAHVQPGNVMHWIPVKGASGVASVRRGVLAKSDWNIDYQNILCIIDTIAAKDKVFSMLEWSLRRAEPVWIYPDEPACGYDHVYFQGLISEVAKPHKKDVVHRHSYVPITARNEPLDLRVYNLAIMQLIGGIKILQVAVARQNEILKTGKPAGAVPKAVRARRRQSGRRR